jgi:hypothetical protein
VKHDSYLDLRETNKPLTLTGSDLLRMMVELEADTVKKSPVNGRSSLALKIGVSVSPELDSDTFFSAGADEVWGKPPPHIDEYLRDTLMARLAQKRRGKNVRSTTV